MACFRAIPRLLTVAAAIVCFWFTANTPSAFAAVVTWDGGGGADTNWSTCANWSGNTCPTSSDVATFDATSLTNTTIATTLTGSTAPAGVDINLGYTGMITQNAGVAIAVGATGWDQAAGTFTGGNSTIDISGDFVLSAGTFTSTSGSLLIDGVWTHTAGGTFTHNSGTVVKDSGAGTWDVATNETFYNLTFSGSSLNTCTIATGDTLIAVGTLALEDCIVSTGSLEARGNVSITTGFDGGTSPITFTGTADQTISGTGTGNYNSSITINKSSGTVSLGAAMTWDAGSSSTFTLASGTFSTADYALEIDGATLVSGGTFNAGASTINFDAALSIEGGTFNANTATVNIAGAFTHTVGGTFNANTSTVVADGSSVTWDVSTSETFYNFTLNKSNATTLTITAGDTLIALNTLTFEDGLVSTGSLEARGNVSITTGFDGGTSPITFTGTADQTISGTGTGNYNSSITINKSSGTVSLGAAMTWNAGSSSTFTLTSGTFSTAGYALEVDGTVLISAGTFNAGASAIEFDGAVTITGGTFNANTATVNIAGAFTHTAGGTFNANTSTVAADGSSVTWDVSTSETFYNFTLNKGNTTTLTITAGDTLIVTGALALTEGRALTGTLEAQGDVTIATGYDTATTTVLTFAGSATQTFTTNDGSNYDADINVNKSGGQVNMVGAFTMNASSQDLTIQEGTFDVNGYALTVQGAATEKLIVETGGNLQLQGGETITADSASYPQLDSGSTVTYDGTSGPYTMKDYTYHHLTINGGATSVFTQAANESYGGNVTITQGILSQGGFTTAVTGTFSNDGTLRRLQTETFTGTMDVNSGTVEYVGDGDAQETVTVTDFNVGGGSVDYYNLKINDANVTKDIFALGAALIVDGTLQVTSAEFQQGANAVTAAAVTVDGGTLTGGSSAVTVSGALTISSGVLTSTSNTLSVGGGWTHTAGGTFTHNSGTVAFTGSAATIDVASTETFSALTINKTDGQTQTIASGDSLIATGTLTLTNGAFATGGIEARGNAVVSSTWDAGGSGTLTFGSTGTQTLDFTGATAALDNPVVINKSGGSVTLASAYTLDHANADFTLTLGTFSTGDYAVTTSSGSDIAVNGGTLNAGASTMTIAGLLTVAGGTYNGNTSSGTISGAFALSSGAYNGNTSSPTFSGTFTISGGTFTASSGTTTVAGSFTHTAGGTFTHNSGVVSFTGSDATIDVASTETFNGLTVNKTGGQTLTISSGDSLIAAGTITLTDGAVGTGTLDARGNVTVGAAFDGGNAPLKFAGAAAQSFDLTGATDKFNADIEVAKSDETVSLASNLVMDAAGQDLTVTTGTFSANTRNLTVAGNAAVNGGTLSFSTGAHDLNGNVTVGGGTLNLGSATVTLAGNATYASGTMTQGTSTVTLDGTSQQLSGATNWYNLTKSVASADTLTLPASTTTTVSGTLTLTGQSGALLSLRSSSSGTRATLAAGTVASPSYLDVKDNTLSPTTRCLTTTQGCVNSQNNSGWTFSSSASTATPTTLSGGAGSSGTVGDAAAPTTVGGFQALLAPRVTIAEPNGGEVVSPGEAIIIAWSSENIVTLVSVAVSYDDGDSWETIAEEIPNNGAYAWIVPSAAHETLEATIRVQATDLAAITASDTSDAHFAITGAPLVDGIFSVDDGSYTDDYTEDVTAIASRIATFPQEISIHSLIKLPDDGDPTTQSDSAVYYVGADGKRHAFPNEFVFKTWFCAFDNVEVIAAADMATVELGSNVTYRPGTRLVKFQSIAKVYAVDRYGVLRWITNEAIASALYGTDWNTKIDDISDTFYGNYEFGDDVTSADDYSAQQAEESVAYPSDNLVIPGYSSVSGSEGLVCSEE